MSSKNGKHTLVVEFIGVTGVGKSTLLAAVAKFLSAQGLRVCEAEDAILARYGLACPGHPKVRSALVHFLALRQSWQYFFTRAGAKLSRLAFGSIARGMGSLWIGANLLRNFLKRIGFHLLLESLRHDLRDCDIVLCDEGVVHAAHNLFVHTGWQPQNDAIVQFGRMVPKPDLLIWVTAPTTQSAGVILRRGHSRVPGTTAAAQAFAEHAQATFEVLCSVDGLRDKIYRIDNSAQEDEPNAAVIAARASTIAELLKQHLLGCQELPYGVKSTTQTNGFHANGHHTNGATAKPPVLVPKSSKAQEPAHAVIRKEAPINGHGSNGAATKSTVSALKPRGAQEPPPAASTLEHLVASTVQTS